MPLLDQIFQKYVNEIDSSILSTQLAGFSEKLRMNDGERGLVDAPITLYDLYLDPQLVKLDPALRQDTDDLFDEIDKHMCVFASLLPKTVPAKKEDVYELLVRKDLSDTEKVKQAVEMLKGVDPVLEK